MNIDLGRLNGILESVKEYDGYNTEIERLEGKLVENKKTHENMVTGKVTKREIMICIGGAVLAIVFFGVIGLLLSIIAGVVLFVAGYLSVYGKQAKEDAEKYLKNNITPLELKLSVYKGKAETFRQSEQGKDVENVISFQYAKTDILMALMNYIETKRADTIKEAINIWESEQKDEKHQQELRDLNQKLIDSQKKPKKDPDEGMDDVVYTIKEIKK